MAVYTEVPDDDLAGFVAEYDIGTVRSCKGIAEGVENSNFLLQTENGSYILTLYERRVDEGDLPYFLGLMAHLADKGLPCPPPTLGRDGKALRRLCGRPAAIVTFLPGVWHRRVSTDDTGQVGAALADMHVKGMDFPLQRPNSLSVESWRPLFAQGRDRAHEVLPNLADKLEAELDHLEAAWPICARLQLPAGNIHADLFPDNVFFLGDRLSGLIDFYFACTDFLCYDLGVCLNAWCFEADGSFNITKARLMFAGYRGVRELSQAEMEVMPLMARGSAMRFLLTRLYDWLHRPEGAMVTPKDPLEYVRKLRFHQRVGSAAAYGLD